MAIGPGSALPPDCCQQSRTVDNKILRLRNDVVHVEESEPGVQWGTTRFLRPTGAACCVCRATLLAVLDEAGMAALALTPSAEIEAVQLGIRVTAMTVRGGKQLACFYITDRSYRQSYDHNTCPITGTEPSV